MSDYEFPLPPPTFDFLVFSLKTQAEMHLGMVAFGDEPEKPNLPAARHAIDMLAMIGERTRGTLSIEEQRLVENSLTELRFRFVQVSESANAEAAKSEETKTEGEKASDAEGASAP